MDQKELLWRESEWRKCAKSSVYFTSNYGTMWTKEGGAPIDWELWECQKDALTQWEKTRLSIILKTRQLGMSWTVCAYALWKILFTDNAHCYMQSIGRIEVAEQTARIKFIYNNLPDWMRQRVEMGGRGRKDNDSLTEFANGSALHAVATTKRAGHGAAPTLYILDEFARNEHAVMGWRAVKPSLAARGQVIVISTANGKGNKYHDLWVDATAGRSQIVPIFYPATAHPDYTPEFLAREKEDYAGDEVGYYEAYPMTPDEAFMSSSRCPFDSVRIEEHLRYIAENKISPEIGRLDYDPQGRVVFIPDKAGAYQIWKHPLVGQTDEDGRKQPRHYYAIGADVAEGLVDGDFSVAIVIDDDTGEIAGMYRHKVKPEHYGNQLKMLGEYYGTAMIAVEVNVGSDYIIDDLKANYPNLYCRERRERIYDAPTLEVGFRTTAVTRPRIITQLRHYFASTEKPLRIYSKTLLHEMSTFEEDGKHKLQAAKGKYDDCVIACAIAIECARTMPRFAKHEVMPKHRRLGAHSL